MKRATGPATASRATPRRSASAVDRHLVYAQPAPLGQHEQLGVEEPALVAHAGQQRVERVAPRGLEAALGVAELHAQDRVQQRVVAARDQLSLGAAHDAGAGGQPRPDGEVRMGGQQRRDEGQQRAQVGREIDVRVGDHAGVARRPRGAQRAAAALAVEAQRAHAGQLGGQPAGDLGRGVRAGVVGDDDPPREGELRRQVAVQAPDARLEAGLLVVDRHHHVEHRGGERHAPSIGPARMSAVRAG
jgi:hypothetical protein